MLCSVIVTVVHSQIVVVVVVSSVLILEAEVVIVGRAIVAFDEVPETELEDVVTPELVLFTAVGVEELEEVAFDDTGTLVGALEVEFEELEAVALAEAGIEELKLDEVTFALTGTLVGALELEFEEIEAVALAGPLEGAAEELELTPAKPEVGRAELVLLMLAEEVTDTGAELEVLFL